MKKIFTPVLLICLLFPALSHAQYYSAPNKVWAMPRHTGLDFTGGGPQLLPTSFYDSTLSGSPGKDPGAAIGDGAGNLLFYSNGRMVWNAQGNIMPNGHDLNTAFPGATHTLGVVIVPAPGYDDTRYYMFSLGNDVTGLLTYTLYCNVVDMTLNNGSGDIDTADAWNGKILSTTMQSRLLAIGGCNNNIWLLTQKHYDNGNTGFRIFNITSTGIDTAMALMSMPQIATAWGQLKINPQKDKIVETCVGKVFTYDFNNQTGIVSNQQVLDNQVSYSSAFSPDGSKLYVQITAPSNIYQYDMTAPTPSQTKVLIAGTSINNVQKDMRLAPDGKIYFGSNVGFDAQHGFKYFARINNPNNMGLACNYQDSVTALVFPSNQLCGNTLPQEVALPGGSSTLIAQVVLDTTICNYANIVLQTIPGTANRLWDNGSTGVTRTITQAGIYWVNYDDGLCSKFSDTFKVHGVPLLPLTIVQNGNVLSTTNTYNTYQWYHGTNPVPGATNPTFTITVWGLYSVKVGNNSGCFDSLAYQATTGTGINNTGYNAGDISIFPNPAGDHILINSMYRMNLSLYTVEGKRVRSATLSKEMDLSGLPGGLYLLRMEEEKGNFVKMAKVVKQ